MILNYLIAGLKLSFNMEHDEYFESALAPYLKKFNGNPDVLFEIEKTDIAPNVSDDIPKNTIGENKYYCKADGLDTVYYFDTILNKIIALVSFSDDYSKVSVKALKLNIDGLTSKYFIFNLVGNALHHIIQMKGGFVFHASAVSCENQGVAFSAKSGTGKTTHTSLWLKYIKNCIMLNDDTPVIRIDNSDNVYIYGTPWAGTSGRNTNFSIPLKAIVFLKRSETNKIERIYPDEAVKLFYKGITPPLSPAMLTASLNTMDKILKLVPTYLLSCNMQPDAAKVAYDAIFEN